MKASELLVDGFPHGTVAGYDRGCRGGICPSPLACRTVWMRYRSDLTFRRQIDAGVALEQIMAGDLAAVMADVAAEREARRAERAQTHAPRERDPHRSRTAESRRREWSTADDDATEHGSLTMYLRGCRDDSCPCSPSCSEVAHTYYLEHNRATVRKVQPHGTNASYVRGCKVDKECPNFGTDEPTCKEAERAYHAEYMAKRRQRAIPAENHGTAYGYQLGCKAGAPCPASPSCNDVALLASRESKRRSGVAPAEPMIDASPVREHVRDLMKSMPLQAIAERAGVHRSQLSNLIYGRSGERGRSGAPMQKVTASRAERIMAVQP